MQRIKDAWKKIRNHVGSTLRYLTVGNNLISKFLTGINFTLILLTFLRVNSVEIPKIVMIILMCCVITGVLFLGWFYDRIGLWKSEIAFDNKRNVVLNEILDRVKIIEEKQNGK